MADWFRSNPVAYQVYNEGHPKHSLNNYPRSKAAYKEEFQTSAEPVTAWGALRVTRQLRQSKQ
jgi:hypothetical protein